MYARVPEFLFCLSARSARQFRDWLGVQRCIDRLFDRGLLTLGLPDGL